MEISDYTKLEIAKEILARKMAIACEKGFNPNDPVIKMLLEEEKQMNKFDTRVIDKIINVYGNELNKTKDIETTNSPQMGE